MESDPPDEDEEEGTAQIRLENLVRRAPPAVQIPFLIVYSGEDAGRMIRISGEEYIGRSSKASLRLVGEGVSRIHARLYADDNVMHIEDLGSTNGTRINGERLIGVRALEDGDQIQIGVNMILKFSMQDEDEARFQEQLFEAALRDPLTKVFNRRALIDRLESDLSHSHRHNAPLSLLLFDLDHFKRINDQYGHLAGDHVLKEFANLVVQTVRREDMFARYGGEEFALICRSTPVGRGRDLADRIRRKVMVHEFIHDNRKISVTVSVGVASEWAEANVETLIERADKMLYQAKDSGRNCVVAFIDGEITRDG